MTSNYRIVVWPGGIHQIHRVYYNDAGEAVGVDSDPAIPAADSAQHLSNLLVNFQGAFREEVINGEYLLQQSEKSLGNEIDQAIDFLNNR